jgi:hypothetical protein
MKLKQALFQMPDVSIFQVDSDDESFLDWEVEPIIAPTLAADYVRDEILDGLFIIKAVHISTEGELEDCYLDVVMSERISETAYLQSNGEIVGIMSYRVSGEIIPTVAIEGFGLYELFYSRLKPEIGLSVLRNGLKVAKRKGYIAADMAYILRDENRKLEAIEAFDIVIAEGEANEYTYLERAALREETGDLAGAIRDREEAARIVKTRPTIQWT